MARHVIVMVTTSYPRFPGDFVGTFMEPIAKGIANAGHDVHIVAPWHPRITRAKTEDGVHFHFFRYAPVESLNVFGYAASMRADERLRKTGWALAPLAMTAGWFKAMRVAQKRRATIMHAHWVIPGGVIAAAARPRLPLVVSLHGSDVFVAERSALAGRAARAVFHRAGFVTACSADLARRAVALGAAPDRLEVVPYGVDAERFKPSPDVRTKKRAEIGAPPDAPVIFTAGRLVRKKGFEYLIDALPMLSGALEARLVIAGSGDLDHDLRRRASERRIPDRVHFLGDVPQHTVAEWFAAADVAAVPSVRDDSGNVDGLPNTVLEALASGTPVVATAAGGIGGVIADGRTGVLVPERDPSALAAAIDRLITDAAERVRLGRAGRDAVMRTFGWDAAVRRFESAYDRAVAFKSLNR